MLLEAWKEFEVNNDKFIVGNDPKPQLYKKGENSLESSARIKVAKRLEHAWNTSGHHLHYFLFLTKLFIIILFIN